MGFSFFIADALYDQKYKSVTQYRKHTHNVSKPGDRFHVNVHVLSCTTMTYGIMCKGPYTFGNVLYAY